MRPCYEILGLNNKEGRCPQCPVMKYDAASDALECWLFASSYCTQNGMHGCMECAVYKENVKK